MKYEITDIQHPNKPKLHRIRSIKYIPETKTTREVKVGDLGGYVESENNLSQVGRCWIYDDAEVYENGQVKDYAIVTKKSQVHGNAIVDQYSEILNYSTINGNARVSGNTIVDGCAATISSNISIHGNSKITGNCKLYNTSKSNVKLEHVNIKSMNINFDTFVYTTHKFTDHNNSRVVLQEDIDVVYKATVEEHLKYIPSLIRKNYRTAVGLDEMTVVRKGSFSSKFLIQDESVDIVVKRFSDKNFNYKVVELKL